MGRRNITDSEIDRIRQLRREGFSYSRISKSLNLSKTTCCKYSSDILLFRTQRFRSDHIDVILTKLRSIITKLLDANIPPDSVDSVLKRCRQKLDSYDSETLSVLTSHMPGYTNFINTILDELDILGGRRFTYKIPADTSQYITDKEASAGEDQHIKDDTNNTV